MLNVGQIDEGYVIDHIKAGMSFTLYKYLKLELAYYTTTKIENIRHKTKLHHNFNRSYLPWNRKNPLTLPHKSNLLC